MKNIALEEYPTNELELLLGVLSIIDGPVSEIWAPRIQNALNEQYNDIVRQQMEDDNCYAEDFERMLGMQVERDFNYDGES